MFNEISYPSYVRTKFIFRVAVFIVCALKLQQQQPNTFNSLRMFCKYNHILLVSALSWFFVTNTTIWNYICIHISTTWKVVKREINSVRHQPFADTHGSQRRMAIFAILSLIFVRRTISIRMDSAYWYTLFVCFSFEHHKMDEKSPFFVLCKCLKNDRYGTKMLFFCILPILSLIFFFGIFSIFTISFNPSNMKMCLIINSIIKRANLINLETILRMLLLITEGHSLWLFIKYFSTSCLYV